METLNTYDYVEGTEFEALMPAVMKTAPTIGATEDKKNINFFENHHRGSDYLEVVDIQAMYGDSSSDSGNEGGGESTPTGPTGETGETGPTGETGETGGDGTNDGD